MFNDIRWIVSGCQKDDGKVTSDLCWRRAFLVHRECWNRGNHRLQKGGMSPEDLSLSSYGRGGVRSKLVHRETPRPPYKNTQQSVPRTAEHWEEVKSSMGPATYRARSTGAPWDSGSPDRSPAPDDLGSVRDFSDEEGCNDTYTHVPILWS